MPSHKAKAFWGLLALVMSQGHAAVPDSSHGAPDTPAGRQLTTWLGAFNTGDRNALDQYLEANTTETFRTNLPTEQQLRDQQYVGRFDLAEIEKSEPLEFTGLLKADDNGDLFEIVLQVTPDNAHKLDSLTMAPRPPASPATRLSETALKSALRVRLEEWTKQDRFSGTVLLAQRPHCLQRRLRIQRSVKETA